MKQDEFPEALLPDVPYYAGGGSLLARPHRRGASAHWFMGMNSGSQDKMKMRGMHHLCSYKGHTIISLRTHCAPGIF